MKNKSKKSKKSNFVSKDATLYTRSFYGFNHDQVAKHMEGKPKFCNEFCVNDEYMPVAVYRVAKPNRKKGHKDFLLLQRQDKIVTIRGMTKHSMNKFRYQTGVYCLSCNKILYSINRHDSFDCGCPNQTMVDGGKDYLRYGGKDMLLIKPVKIDLLTSKVCDE